ncbi:RidA family protein [Allonocardiopsis opalescens]|uniref:Enamine deaminase RidA (YjgF/YER057c/UK114 family) n=1 Tax=Allonocardiopsis opalescens TaxID=1144618 RepID=A0A2T0PYQ5_9ACTN|nr:RidA family protein [Allonocardiopsis opalescens]PRX96642.1 enamine deaminase RidA (YjgF/YER057c/UK114 family) [Allonocardiopsis opalescens]
MATTEVYEHGVPAESEFGYAQAVRSGDLIHVSGQLAFDDAGGLFAPDDFAAQLERTHANIDRVLAHYGATRRQIVSQVLYVVGLVRNAAAVAEGNRAYFGGHRAAATAVGVTELTFPGQLVEISCVIDTSLPA